MREGCNIINFYYARRPFPFDTCKRTTHGEYISCTVQECDTTKYLMVAIGMVWWLWLWLAIILFLYDWQLQSFDSCNWTIFMVANALHITWGNLLMTLWTLILPILNIAFKFHVSVSYLACSTGYIACTYMFSIMVYGISCNWPVLWLQSVKGPCCKWNLLQLARLAPSVPLTLHQLQCPTSWGFDRMSSHGRTCLTGCSIKPSCPASRASLTDKCSSCDWSVMCYLQLGYDPRFNRRTRKVATSLVCVFIFSILRLYYCPRCNGRKW